jgi:hypothetical protein
VLHKTHGPDAGREAAITLLSPPAARCSWRHGPRLAVTVYPPFITCLSGPDHDAEMTLTWYVYEQGKGANSGSGAQMLGGLLLDFS